MFVNCKKKITVELDIITLDWNILRMLRNFYHIKFHNIIEYVTKHNDLLKTTYYWYNLTKIGLREC